MKVFKLIALAGLILMGVTGCISYEVAKASCVHNRVTEENIESVQTVLPEAKEGDVLVSGKCLRLLKSVAKEVKGE